MSIRDYSQKFILINGTTNEQIVIPKSLNNQLINVDIFINDLLLLQSVQQELHDCDSISIIKSYMKD